MTRTPSIEDLRPIPLFSALDDPALARVVSELDVLEVGAGETVFRAGDPADGLYVVASGRLRVLGSGGERLSETGPRQVVGEVALLARGVRTATVQAVRDSILYRLPAQTFHRLAGDEPTVALHVAERIVEHLLQREVPSDTAARSIAIVAASPESARVTADFAPRLAVALRGHGSVEVVPEDQALDAATLDRLEASHRFVLIVGGEDAQRARRLVTQVDRVILVADTSVASAVEPDLGSVVQRDLVLVHPGSGSPRRTAAWLSATAPDRWHHVAAGSDADVARVARSVAGRSLGIVLSGGGPRGFAHLGVLHALEEAGMTIDAVGGASVGALMGVMVAMGWTPERREREAIASLTQHRGLFRPTLPVVSMTSGRSVTRAIRAFVGDLAIEDLPVPWFCTSTNLSRGCAVVHDRGPAWLALRASVALPAVIPPVCVDGEVLVDGGVLNNLPVDVMRARLDGSIIAVDLEPAVETTSRRPFGPVVSGWRAVGDILNPRRAGPGVPNLVEIVLRAKQVGGQYAQADVLRRAAPELYLNPPTASLSTLDFRRGTALIEEAYEWATATLAETDLSALR